MYNEEKGAMYDFAIEYVKGILFYFFYFINFKFLAMNRVEAWWSYFTLPIYYMDQ